MSAATETLVLTNEELAFFRMTCDVFPVPESPLRFLDEADAEPAEPETTFARLGTRNLLSAGHNGASQQVHDRLRVVAECNGRVLWTVRQKGGTRVRDYYLADGSYVEYSHNQAGEHHFGQVRPESALVVELAQKFAVKKPQGGRLLRMSASDYLVFAVFARDLRAAPATTSGESMSIEEVLAYFDEPEQPSARAKTDQGWQASIDALQKQKVLVKTKGGYELDPQLQPLVREIVADHQHTIVRFDFLDEEWLVREISLYPTPDTVYRFGTEPDGTVAIEELSSRALSDLLAGVVGTLPNLLASEAVPTLRSKSQ